MAPVGEVSEEPSRRPLCILGVGRSGTSLAASVASALGVDFGPPTSMPASSTWNPQGFWEQLPINALNDEILRALGGSQIDPPLPNPGWERLDELEPMRVRARETVEALFGGSDRWGFKDPRTTLTLPLWQEAIGELDYLICVRNPLEVVASVERVLPQSYDGFGLWMHYNCQALRLTVGRRRLFVFYEDWFHDPVVAVGRLARFTAPGAAVGAEACERARALVKPGLHRRRAHELDLAERDDILARARIQHFLLRDLAHAESRGDPDAAALQILAARLDDQWRAARSRPERDDEPSRPGMSRSGDGL